MNAPLRASASDAPSSDAPSSGTALPEAARRGELDVHRLAEEVGILLTTLGHTLAVGETSAGGALASLVDGDPTNAVWFRGGVVPYAGGGVPFVEGIRDVAGTHGVVSKEYAAALARLVRRAFACDWALAESGIAGPQTGRRSAKPVGMVCFAVAGPKLAQGIAQERGTSPRAKDELQAGDERGTRCHAMAEMRAGEDRGADPVARAAMVADEEQVWTSTRVLADKGRIPNQHQFAVGALDFLCCVLSAQRTVR